MDIERLARAAERALDTADVRIRNELLSDPSGVIHSYDGQPGLWETAEAIGIVRWQADDQDLLASAVQAVLSAQLKDGGFAPWPDITSRAAYCESTTRVLLSIAPVCKRVTDSESLTESVDRATDWLLDNQDASGGWGSWHDLEPRLFPTTFSIQALATVATELGGSKRKLCMKAIKAGAQWIERNQNSQDGGFGTSANEQSNIGSSGHAAWGLTAAGVEVPPSLRSYILNRLDKRLPDSVADKVDDPARDRQRGRYELLILTRPMALIGAVAARADIYEARILRLVRSILRRQADGVWVIDSGRFVWPTYVHVAALRLWLAVHRSHAYVPTSDFRGLGNNAVLRPASSRVVLGQHAVHPPDDWEERLGRLTLRQTQAFVAYVRGRTDKEVAEELKISPRTVEKHRHEALNRLLIEKGNRLEAMAIAVAGGLIRESD